MTDYWEHALIHHVAQDISQPHKWEMTLSPAIPSYLSSALFMALTHLTSPTPSPYLSFSRQSRQYQRMSSSSSMSSSRNSNLWTAIVVNRARLVLNKTRIHGTRYVLCDRFLWADVCVRSRICIAGLGDQYQWRMWNTHLGVVHEVFMLLWRAWLEVKGAFISVT